MYIRFACTMVELLKIASGQRGSTGSTDSTVPTIVPVAYKLEQLERLHSETFKTILVHRQMQKFASLIAVNALGVCTESRRDLCRAVESDGEEWRGM